MNDNISIENLREQICKIAQTDSRFSKKSSDAPGAVYSSVWVPNINVPKTAAGKWSCDIQGMDGKFYEVSFTIGAGDIVTLGQDSKEVNRQVSYEAMAHAAAGEIVAADGKLPTNLQWMPPGKHVVQPVGFPEAFEMEITPAIAQAADRQLQQMLAEYAEGKSAEPYIDINHEDKVRAFLPKKISWAGDDLKNGGIRVDGKWTGGGAKAALNGEQCVISPSWILHKVTKAFLGIKRNLGGLVPASAFSSIQAFAKADSNAQQQPQPKDKMTKEEISQIVTDCLKPIGDRISTLEANAKDDGALGKRLKALEDGSSTMTVANAKKTVEEIGVRGGRIASQDTATIEFWTQAIAKDSKAVDALTKMTVNPAFVTVVHAGGSGNGTVTTTGTEHEFVAKAKAFATEHKIADEMEAQAKFSRTPDGKKLYADYASQMTVGTRK